MIVQGDFSRSCRQFRPLRYTFEARYITGEIFHFLLGIWSFQ